MLVVTVIVVTAIVVAIEAIVAVVKIAVVKIAVVIIVVVIHVFCTLQLRTSVQQDLLYDAFLHIFPSFSIFLVLLLEYP